MSYAAAANPIPSESDWLCEACGYVLTGLPAGGRCPECGKPTDESARSLRQPPLWERPDEGAVKRFVLTTFQLLFRPKRFYRSLATRGDRRKSARFARVHWLIASCLFALAGWLHVDWSLNGRPGAPIGSAVAWPAAIALAAACYVLLTGTIHIAARLTSWEAGYRGLRLPLPVVQRGLDYHAAHYLPVALLAAASVAGYRALLTHDPVHAISWGVGYLYALCGEVVAAAFYLFKTYWTGMRNMMYASR